MASRCRRTTNGAAVSDVPGLITEIFAGYRDHYAANEHLDAELVAVGYAEWATSVATDAANVVVAVCDDGSVVEGLAVVDTGGDVWDVVLAGVRPAARGRGAYGRLMADVMARARADGQRAVRISTQSHNLPVMRTWERLGWRIITRPSPSTSSHADD